MANVCYNEFVFSTDKDYDKYLEKFSQLFDNNQNRYFDGEITYQETYNDSQGGIIEGYFESRWTFPRQIFVELIPDGQESTYFRCLSNEPGCEYFACNVYKNSTWTPEQVFDV